jgi:hypothetical protein
MCLLESYYLPILTYGAETWTWAKTGISRLMAAELRVLGSMEGKPKELE